MSTLSSPLLQADKAHSPTALPHSVTQVHRARAHILTSRGCALSDHLEVTRERLKVHFKLFYLNSSTRKQCFNNTNQESKRNTNLRTFNTDANRQSLRLTRNRYDWFYDTNSDILKLFHNSQTQCFLHFHLFSLFLRDLTKAELFTMI